LTLVVLFAILNFFAAPVNALFPLFVTNYFSADVLKYGWLVTSNSIGLVAGGLIMGVWGGFKQRIVTTLVFIMFQGLAAFTFGFTTESLFFLALAMVFISGVSGAILRASLVAILQSVAAKDMQGRVFALQYSLGGLMNPLALAITGPVADAIGLRTIWWVTGAVLFTLPGLAFFSHDLMTIENKKAEEKTEADIS
jgi:DHA3 family macrolide efflux protein-like MFS transporter